MGEQKTLYCHDCKEKQWVGKGGAFVELSEEAVAEFAGDPYYLKKFYILGRFLREHKGHSIELEGEYSARWPVDKEVYDEVYSRSRLHDEIDYHKLKNMILEEE